MIIVRFQPNGRKQQGLDGLASGLLLHPGHVTVILTCLLGEGTLLSRVLLQIAAVYFQALQF